MANTKHWEDKIIDTHKYIVSGSVVIIHEEIKKLSKVTNSSIVLEVLSAMIKGLDVIMTAENVR